MKTTLPKPRSVKVIDITSMVPEDWDWFWDMVNSSNPDFSFGDNNLTLIQPERFARWIDDAFEWFSSGVNNEGEEEVYACSQEEWKAWVDQIWDLAKEQIYINMEA